MKKSVIDIHGRRYDSETGELLGTNKTNEAKSTQDLRQLQSSTTLNRQFVQKPKLQIPARVGDPRAASKPRIIHNKRRSMDVVNLAHAPSPKIAKFNPGDFNPTNRPVVISEVKNPDVIVTPEQQEVFKQALNRARQADLIQRYRAAQIERARRQQYRKLFAKEAKSPAKNQPLSSIQSAQNRTIKKNADINQALAQTVPKDKKHRASGFWSSVKPSKWLLAVSGLIIIIIGIITYLNWSVFNLALVNHQAGLKATVPAYQPTDYRFDSAASSRYGHIILSLTNPKQQPISITQEKSSWDSDAVLDNFVKPQVGDNYTTYRDQGLTIYAYKDNQLVWVNGGTLYQINADASVPSEQLRRMATSL